ncbi:hypothetical protein JRQ81_001701 [Phrynocephalus forsythii]|uniref:Cytochrome P450 n=1 Tax=Phrynocephalus forsythii TaxID=171643 RepID=A0A9Q1B9K4_9SAUR|nr:hypothetical protein JRQ81_001701 [Phrynocephalus forsythii]
MDQKRPYRTMLKLSKEYGPVFSLQMGLQKMVVLTGYETIKEALVNQADAFAERPLIPIFEAFAKGFGILFSHGENWKAMRRFALATLRDYGMGKRSIEDKIVEECNVLIKKFKSYEGKPFETTMIMNAAVANIIVSILLGKRFEYEDPTIQRLLQLVNENVRLFGSPSVMLCNMFPALGLLFGARKTVLNNRDEIHAFITATFINHLKDLDKNDQRSFIDTFLIQQQKLSKKYGPIFSLQMGLRKMVVLTGYETVKEALVDQADAFAERPIVPMFEEFSNGLGISFSHGENWKVMRRFALATLRDYGMGKRAIEDKAVEECNVLIKKIGSYEGKPLNTTADINVAIANIMLSIMLGKRFEYDDPTIPRLLHLINENLRLIGTPSVMLFNSFPSLGFLSGARKTLLNNRDELHSFVRATLTNCQNDLDKNNPKNFIDAFLIRQQELFEMVGLALCKYKSASKCLGERSILVKGGLEIIDEVFVQKYGPVFSLHLGLQKIVVLTGYETVKEALVDQADAFAERPYIPLFEEFTKGFGIVRAHGENWKVMRRFTLATLRDYGMGKRSIEDKIVEECVTLVKKFESFERKPFETTQVMNAAVANIIVSILLGKRFEYENLTFQQLLQLVDKIVLLFATPSAMVIEQTFLET